MMLKNDLINSFPYKIVFFLKVIPIICKVTMFKNEMSLIYSRIIRVCIVGTRDITSLVFQM